MVLSPTCTLSVSPSGTICAGDNARFAATSGYTNYLFKLNGTTTLQNGTDSIFNTTGLVNGDKVTVDVTNSNSCTTTFNTVTMIVNQLPTGTLVGVENSGVGPNDSTICAGATVIFTAPAGFANYDFILNGVSIPMGTSNTYSNSSLVSGDQVTVAVTNAGGCVGLLNLITMTVNPLPVISPITGPGNVCLNSTITLSDGTIGGVWTSSNTSIATVVPSTGVVTGLASGTAVITYTFTNTNGCSTAVTTTIIVNATTGCCGNYRQPERLYRQYFSIKRCYCNWYLDQWKYSYRYSKFFRFG